MNLIPETHINTANAGQNETTSGMAAPAMLVESPGTVGIKASDETIPTQEITEDLRHKPTLGDTHDFAALIRKARKEPNEVAALVATRKKHLAIPIMKPPAKGKFWRVREGDGWTYQENIFLLLPADFDMDRREFQLIRPDLEDFVMSKPQLRAATKTFGLAFMVDTFGAPACWALNLADTGNWGTSARNIAEELKHGWGAVISESGRYVCVRPEDELGDPVWPEGGPDEWLAKAFSGRVIDSENHPEFNKLLGRKS